VQLLLEQVGAIPIRTRGFLDGWPNERVHHGGPGRGSALGGGPQKSCSATDNGVLPVCSVGADVNPLMAKIAGKEYPSGDGAS
jgi:hypothetical protein